MEVVDLHLRAVRLFYIVVPCAHNIQVIGCENSLVKEGVTYRMKTNWGQVHCLDHKE